MQTTEYDILNYHVPYMLYALYCYKYGFLIYAIQYFRFYMLCKMGVAAICYNHLLASAICYILLNGLCYMILETPGGGGGS